MVRSKKTISGEQLKDIERLAGFGLSVEKIAAYLGMSKATLDRRVSESIEVSSALERGRSFSEEAVASTAFQMATSGKHPSVTMFWLKTRAGWRENFTKNPTSGIELSYKIEIDKDDECL